MPYKYAVALATSLGLFMAVLDNTIVNVSLVAMQESFGTGLADVQWVITAYFLAQAAIIPTAGYLANWFGQKRMYMFFLGVFTVGSLLCGLAEFIGEGQGLALLVAFRVVQGIGGGALFPLATAISFNVFKPEERAVASAFVAVPVLIAPTIGPTVGGLIVDSSLGWPWIFFINVPVGAIALFLVARILQPDQPHWATPPALSGRESATGPAQAATAAVASGGTAPAAPATPERSPFDWFGLVTSMAGVVLVAYAFNLVGETRPDSVSASAPNGEVYGWGYWLFWLLLAVGIVLLAVFAFYELRWVRDPVLDLRLFSSYTFTVSTVLTWIVRAVVFGSFFLLPVYLQQYRELSAVEAGLALAPQGIGSAVGVLTGSRLYDIVGPRRLVTVGIAILAASTYWLTAVDTGTTWVDLLPILLLRGIGFGWGNLPLQTAALSDITGPALPKASSLYNATAQVFSSIGIAVISTVFVQQVTRRALEMADEARAAGASTDGVLAEAGADATSYVFLLLTYATLVCMILALLLPSKSIRQQMGDQGEATAGNRGRPAVAE